MTELLEQMDEGCVGIFCSVLKLQLSMNIVIKGQDTCYVCCQSWCRLENILSTLMKLTVAS